MCLNPFIFNKLKQYVKIPYLNFFLILKFKILIQYIHDSSIFT